MLRYTNISINHWYIYMGINIKPNYIKTECCYIILQIWYPKEVLTDQSLKGAKIHNTHEMAHVYDGMALMVTIMSVLHYLSDNQEIY